MSRVLLTGASGFIGRHVLAKLTAAGHEVHAVARRRGPEHERVVWHEVDLLDPGAAAVAVRDARARSMLHLAWYAVPGKFWIAAENERWIDASVRLLRAFGEAGGQRAVMAGSCAEYRWDDERLREQDSPGGPGSPLEPATLYGACKLATFIAAAAVARQLEVSLAWARIFFVYGPGEPRGRLVSDLAAGLLAGEHVPTSDGQQRRDFMHVDDLAGGFAALVDSGLAGAVNIASGTAVPVAHIADLIERVVGAGGKIERGALASRPDDPSVIEADVTRMREQLRFRPTLDLQTGIADTVSWWRSQTHRATSDRD